MRWHTIAIDVYDYDHHGKLLDWHRSYASDTSSVNDAFDKGATEYVVPMSYGKRIYRPAPLNGDDETYACRECGRDTTYVDGHGVASCDECDGAYDKGERRADEGRGK